MVLAGRTWALAGAKESRGFPTKDEGKRVWEKGRSQREGGIQTLPVSGVVGWWEVGGGVLGLWSGPSSPFLAHPTLGCIRASRGCV